MIIYPNWEVELIVWLQSTLPFLKIIMEFFTLIGKSDFYPIILAFLLLCVDAKLAIRSGIVLTSIDGFTTFFKNLFHAPRPFWISSKIKPWAASHGFGLPSGHASVSTIWIYIAKAIKNKIFWIIAIILVTMICLSRVFLGAHFLSQVLAGLILGIAVIILFIKLEPKVVKFFKKKDLKTKIISAFIFSIIFIILGAIIATIFQNIQIPTEYVENFVTASNNPDYGERLLIKASDMARNAGMLFGILLASILLFNGKGFSAKGSIKIKAIRFVIGTALIYGLTKAAKAVKLIPDMNMEILIIFKEYLVGFIVMFFAFFVVPKILIKFKLAKTEKN